jgi:glycosyltransferase involved in cell wall biosynthesis
VLRIRLGSLAAAGRRLTPPCGAAGLAAEGAAFQLIRHEGSDIAILVLHAFDAEAGAQRVAAQLVEGFRGTGLRTRLWLGFGSFGFVSRAAPDWRFLPIERPAVRKLLYPLWVLAAGFASIGPLIGGARFWANSYPAVAAAWPALLFAPRRLVIHLHENGLPPPFGSLVRRAGRRGAAVLAVSAHHASRLGMPVRVLPNAVGAGDPPQPPAERRCLVFVGTASAMKGFPLFLAIARALAGSALVPTAFLAAGPDRPDEVALAAARAAGVKVHVGETRPAVHYAEAFLALQLTDPALADETFSLVAAEAVWHLVPVAGAGSAVLAEVAGPGLAFNIAGQDAAAIAAAIRSLLDDPAAHAALVEGCRRHRRRFALERFHAEAAGIAIAAHA